MKKSLLTTLAASAALVATPASAGTLLALDNRNDTLVSIDTGTGIFTTIGALGTDANFADLAYDGTTLWALGGRDNENLYTVDINTGAASLVGNHGLRDLFGLAVDRTTGTLYASQFFNGQNVYTLDSLTGAATLLTQGTNQSFGSMAYRGDTDQLIAQVDGSGTFWEVDRTTGNATQISAGDGFTNNSDFAYDGDLGVFWLLDFSGNFYQYDATLGSRTLISGGNGNFDGLAYLGANGGGGMGAVPEPASWAFMIVGFGAMGSAMRSTRRRRKVNLKLSYA